MVQTVNIHQKPTALFYATSFCTPGITSFTDISKANNGMPLTNWYWNFGDGTGAFTQNITHYYAKPGKYSVTLKITDWYGCTDSMTKTIEIYEIPKSTFKVILKDSYYTFIPDDTLQSLYVWSFSDGTNSISMKPTKEASANWVNPSANLTVTSAKGCTSSWTNYFSTNDIFKEDQQFGLSIYPNPISSEVQIDFTLIKPTEINLYAYSCDGKNLGNLSSGIRMSGSHHLSINTSDWKPGFYYLRLQIDEQWVEKKLIKY